MNDDEKKVFTGWEKQIWDGDGRRAARQRCERCDILSPIKTCLSRLLLLNMRYIYIFFYWQYGLRQAAQLLILSFRPRFEWLNFVLSFLLSQRRCFLFALCMCVDAVNINMLVGWLRRACVCMYLKPCVSIGSRSVSRCFVVVVVVVVASVVAEISVCVDD